MLANPAFVIDTLTDVIIRGAAVVDKKRLLYALGAKQDRPAVWGRLLDAWEELDQDRDTLRGIEIWTVTLVLIREDDPKAAPSKFDLVTAWT